MNDPGCSSSGDNSESPDPAVPQCRDGADNDGDGLTDMDDPGCSNPEDNTENTPQCSDGRDNDGDGLTDMDDPGCSDPEDRSENTPQCSDGRDNDGDGLTDMADPDCSGASDDSEWTAWPTATPCVNCNVTVNVDTEVNVGDEDADDDDGDDEDDNDIVLAITDDRETLAPGGTATYRVTVRNEMNEDKNGVTIKATLPSYFSASSASADGHISGFTVTWDDEDLSAESELTFSVTGKVAADAPNGYVLRGLADINGDGLRLHAYDTTMVVGGTARVASASTEAQITTYRPVSVPVSAATGMPIGAIPAAFSISGLLAGAGALLTRKFLG